MRYLKIILFIITLVSCTENNDLVSDNKVLDQLVREKYIEIERIHKAFPRESDAWYKLVVLRYSSQADSLIDLIHNDTINEDSLKNLVKSFFNSIDRVKSYDKVSMYNGDFLWTDNKELLYNRIRLGQYDLLNYTLTIMYFDKPIFNKIGLLTKKDKGYNRIYVTMNDSINIPFWLIRASMDGKSNDTLDFNWQAGYFVDKLVTHDFIGDLYYKNLFGDTLRISLNGENNN